MDQFKIYLPIKYLKKCKVFYLLSLTMITKTKMYYCNKFKLKGDPNPKRFVAKNLKIEIDINSCVKLHEEFKSGIKFALYR